MGMNGAWNWRLTVPKTTKLVNHQWPTWRWLSELTVLLLHVAPSFCLQKLSPHWLPVVVGSQPLDRCLPPSPYQLPTSEINQAFLSTNLTVYWLLSGKQLDPLWCCFWQHHHQEGNKVYGLLTICKWIKKCYRTLDSFFWELSWLVIYYHVLNLEIRIKWVLIIFHEILPCFPELHHSNSKDSYGSVESNRCGLNSRVSR